MKLTRSAFTLVELLVVITIIGILMGLLLPAINAARESARRNQCSGQIKNLALAAIQHENTKGEMPGFLQAFGDFAGGADPSDPTATDPVAAHVKRGSWVVSLMPWLDAQPTYEIWTEDRYPIITASGGYSDGSSPNLAIMQCPSNPNSDSDKARNSYISNNGMQPLLDSGGTGGSGTAYLVDVAQSMSRANGVFNNKLATNSPKIRLDDMKDGQGNTMLFSENVQALPWNQLGTPNLTSPANARYGQGMVWHYEDSEYAKSYPWSHGTPPDVAPKHKINGRGLNPNESIFNEKMTAPVGSTADIARPSSAHVDGVNAGMADGGTRYITNSIDYRVYQALLTPRGKSSDVPWQEYVLDEEAF